MHTIRETTPTSRLPATSGRPAASSRAPYQPSAVPQAESPISFQSFPPLSLDWQDDLSGASLGHTPHPSAPTPTHSEIPTKREIPCSWEEGSDTPAYTVPPSSPHLQESPAEYQDAQPRPPPRFWLPRKPMYTASPSQRTRITDDERERIQRMMKDTQGLERLPLARLRGRDTTAAEGSSQLAPRRGRLGGRPSAACFPAAVEKTRMDFTQAIRVLQELEESEAVGPSVDSSFAGLQGLSTSASFGSVQESNAGMDTNTLAGPTPEELKGLVSKMWGRYEEELKEKEARFLAGIRSFDPLVTRLEAVTRARERTVALEAIMKADLLRKSLTAEYQLDSARKRIQELEEALTDMKKEVANCQRESLSLEQRISKIENTNRRVGEILGGGAC